MPKERNLTPQSRREFLRQAACAAVGTAALSFTIRDLRFMNAAVAQSNINDYKALVCIFLAGGNDSNNLIIPTIQAEYDSYFAARTSQLAIPLTGAPGTIVLPVTADNSDGHNYGFHPSCQHLVNLFNEHKLALLFNTGTLVYPGVSHALYKAGISKTPQLWPPQLFSHADQVTQWQTSDPDQPPTTGWGGRTADLLAATQPGAKVSLSVSLAGANTLEVGSLVSQYSVSSSGAIALSLPGSGSAAYTNRLIAVTNIMAQSYPNMQAQAYAGVVKHSVETGQILNTAIDPFADLVDKNSSGASGTYVWSNELTGNYSGGQTGGFPNTTLGRQLKMAARMIAARNTLNMKRQIFFCSVGGYDTHTGQTNGPAAVNTGQHANLLNEISTCVLAFQRAMEQLAISNKVTAFTASDFGRTFPCNGDGTDHGWGSHHLIIGGAVNGKRTYGKFPALVVNGPDDTDTGRWIPTTACDQYFATLATWFGVDSSNLDTVFPNLDRFASPNLGFV
jgi:uncharacterized protein (DUF1501 family)